MTTLMCTLCDRALANYVGVGGGVGIAKLQSMNLFCGLLVVDVIVVFERMYKNTLNLITHRKE